MPSIRKSIVTSARFFLALAVLHAAFFFLYYHAAALSFTWMSLAFVLLLSAALAGLFGLSRPLAWLLYAAFLLYCLVNLAYHDVYGYFLRLSGSQLSQLNLSLLDLISDFHFLVPWYLYLGVVALFLAIFFLQRALQPGLRRAKIVLLALLVAALAGSLLLQRTYQSGLDQDSFSRAAWLGDLGPYGYLIYSVAGQEGDSGPQSAASQDLSDIKEGLASLDALSPAGRTVMSGDFSQTEKPHVVIYQVESFGAWALEQEPSPVPGFESFAGQNVRVGDFYSNSCTTNNAELSALCSFLPESYGPISDLYSKNDYYCLPSVLADRHGYRTAMYHSNSADFWNRKELAPRWGFQDLYFTPYYDLRRSDEYILRDVAQKIGESEGPTFNYVIGFTTHSPHDEERAEFQRALNGLDVRPYEGELSENSLATNESEDTVRHYFGSLSTIDGAISGLMQGLEESGQKDNTIVIVFGDHRYYNFVDGDPVSDFYNYNRIPFAMHVPGGYQGMAQEIASQLDIAPTLLHLIEGDGFQAPESFLGQSMLGPGHSNSAISTCLGRAFYVDSEIIVRGEVAMGFYSQLGEGEGLNPEELRAYTEPLQEVVRLTGKMFRDNSLVGQPAARAQEEEQISFDQETDSDQDGLSNLRERGIGTDPDNPDTDGDGILDGPEVVAGTDPLVADKE